MASKKCAILSRVNVNDQWLETDTILEADSSIVDELVKRGFADTSKESIAYCEKELGKKTVSFEAVEEKPAKKKKAE